MLRCFAMVALALLSSGCNLILGLDEGSERTAAGGGGQGEGASGSGGGATGAGGAGGDPTTTTGMGGDPGTGGGGGPPEGRLMMGWSFEDAGSIGWLDENIDMASVADAAAPDGARVLELTNLTNDAQSGDIRSVVAQSVPIGQCIRLGGYSRRVSGDVSGGYWILRVNAVGYEEALAPTGSGFMWGSVTCELEAEAANVTHGFFDLATVDGGALAKVQIDDVRLEIVDCVGGEQPCHL